MLFSILWFQPINFVMLQCIFLYKTTLLYFLKHEKVFDPHISNRSALDWVITDSFQ
jgi:hypothetical protein